MPDRLRSMYGMDYPSMTAAASIVHAHQVMLKRIDQALKPYQLNFSRFEALLTLAYATDGRMPLGRLGERLHVHPTSATNTIDRLEKCHLVVRCPDQLDRRTVFAQITTDGRIAVSQAASTLEDIQFGLCGLDQTGLERVSADLQQLT